MSLSQWRYSGGGEKRPRKGIEYAWSRLQHSRLEFANFRIERRRFECPGQRVARVRWVDDGIHPKPCGGITRVGLMFIRRADGFVELLLLLLVELLTRPLQLLELDFDE